MAEMNQHVKEMPFRNGGLIAKVISFPENSVRIIPVYFPTINFFRFL